MEGPELKEFLRVGYERYAEAMETIGRFEEEVKRRLESALKGANWQHFRARRGAGGVQKDISLKAPRPTAYGTWINAFQACADEGEPSIELGLMWGSKHVSGKPILYINRYSRGPLAESLDDPEPPVRCENMGDGRPRLLIVVDEHFDLDAHARLLVAEMDRSLGKSKGPDGGS